MVSVAEAGIDLFGPSIPSLEQIEKLANIVNSSEINQITFRSQLSSKLQKNDPESSLAGGIGLWIIGDNSGAVAKLAKAKDSLQKSMCLAYAYRKLEQYDEALANFDKARSQQVDMLKVTVERVATLRHAKRFDDAAKELKTISNFERISAEYHYQAGRLQEAQGLYEAAIDNFHNAIEIDPGHQKSLFHLAFECDLRGDEEAAIDYYKQLATHSPVYVSGLLNLAVLFEDKAEFEKAIKCVHMVLEAHPNHKRGLLFYKDLESSRTMFYDEEREKKLDKRNQILEIPISDFELSVRSRNCLRKMGIRTIGDLLRTSEAELLSYKNFGETSLAEIKSILGSKGLRLGMALEDKAMPAAKPAASSSGGQGSDDMLNKTVEEFELSVRARKCLQRLNIRTISELVSRTEAELLGCKNFGITSLSEIKQKLGNYGISLRKLE